MPKEPKRTSRLTVSLYLCGSGSSLLVEVEGPWRTHPVNSKSPSRLGRCWQERRTNNIYPWESRFVKILMYPNSLQLPTNVSLLCRTWNSHCRPFQRPLQQRPATTLVVVTATPCSRVKTHQQTRPVQTSFRKGSTASSTTTRNHKRQGS